MKTIIGKIFKTPTLFSIFGFFLIVIGLPIGIYGLTLKGGGSLGGAIILLGVFVVGIIYVIDRLIVSKINQKKLNRIEFALLIIGVTSFLFTEREIIIDLREKQTDYFIVIENNGTLKTSELNYSFPFNKKIEFNDNVAVVNSIAKNYQRIELKNPSDWKSQRMQPWKLNNFIIRFYSNGNLKLTEKEIDAIIKKEINTVAKKGYNK